MKSWDIKIAGEQYVFGGVPGLTLGKAPIEPGNDGQIDTVVIESLHGGIGHPQKNGVMRYKEARNADLTAPRFMLPRYTITTPGSVTSTDSTGILPRFSHWENQLKTFLISGGKHWEFNEVTGALTSAVSGNFDTGGFYYLGLPVFSGASSGFVWGTGSRGIVYFIKNSNILTYAPQSAEAFRTEHTGTSFIPGPPVRPPDPPNPPLEVYDIPGFGFDENFPSRYSEFPQEPTDSVPDPGGVYIENVSWMTMIGHMLVIFTYSGSIIAANESGIFSTAARLPQMPNTGFNMHVGVGSAPWQNGLLVPSPAGLFYFNPVNLELRRWGLNFIQSETEARLTGEVTGVGSSGDYAFVAVQTPTGARAYEIMPYDRMVAVHDITPAVSGPNIVITDFFISTTATVGTASGTFTPGTGATYLFYIEFNTSTFTSTIKRLNLHIPSDDYMSDTGLTTSAECDLYPMSGPDPAANMTKRWMAIRGRWEKGSGNAQLQFSSIAVDGIPITDRTVSDDGAFSIQLTDSESESALLGRDLGFTIKLVNPTHDTKLIFPLMMDFEWAPDTTDAMQVQVLVSGEVKGNVAAHWEQGPWGTTEHLLSLQGQIVEVVLPYASNQPGGFDEYTTWQCLIQKVAIVDTPAPDGHGPIARSAKLAIRRIS